MEVKYKNEKRSRIKVINKIIIGVVVGLVVGLVLGVFVGIAVYPSVHSGVGTHNQVQVSGKVLETGISWIQFINLAGNTTTATTAPITNGAYDVLIVGGQSYNVYLLDQHGADQKQLSLYVPSGVTTFHADF